MSSCSCSVIVTIIGHIIKLEAAVLFLLFPVKVALNDDSDDDASTTAPSIVGKIYLTS